MPEAPVGTSRSHPAARAALVGVIAFSLGILTAYGQEWLPSELGSLANSSGSWSLIAFGLALLLASGLRSAALIGSFALLALLIGYVVGANVRGFASGTALIAFWGMAALLAGPLIGIGGYWTRSGEELRRAVGIGAMSGVLIGEGLYGVTYIADTTYVPYWWGQVILGLLLAGLVVGRGPQRVGKAVTAGGVGSLVAVAFIVVSVQDLITLLP